MHPTLAPAPLAALQRATLFAPIARDLEEVERILRQTIESSRPGVGRLIAHLAPYRGKRLRPALLLLTAQACGPVNAAHHVLGAVVEMIHTATLVHDDVLDGAVVRRHLETVNARWNNQSSVLLGDFLFTHSFYLAATVGSTFACQTIGRATNIVCEGELRQVANRGNLALTEAEYLSMIEAKTAELCACCCRLGAHYAHADAAAVDALERYGRYLGIAFQIVDDLLDLVGDEHLAGKSLGTDLEQQKLTLPLIRLLNQLSETDRRLVRAILTRPGERAVDALRPWLESSDALAYARSAARDYAKRAAAQLRLLPAGIERSVLRRLARFVVERRQ